MTHHVPARTVKLGTALVLVTRFRDRVLTWDEVKGFQMLTTPDAMEQAPGRVRLFLVAGKLQREPGEPGRGRDTYERWHKREPELVGMMKVPDEFPEKVGRAVRLDYKSDKWRKKGQPVEYTHDFLEDGGRAPLVYCDNPKRPQGFMLIGGTMAVREAGIS